MFHSALKVLPFLIPLSLSAQSLDEPVSFEKDQIPPNYFTKGGSLSLTKDHIQDGSQALRWDFTEGATLTLNTGALGNINVYTGYGNYSRSALTLPVYLPETGQGKLLVEIRAGEETAGLIEVPFSHAGWQKLVYHYSWHSKIQWTKPKLRDKLDNIRITAKDVEKPGYAIFDKIIYNKPLDFRAGRNAITEIWLPEKHDFSGAAQPNAQDLLKLDQLSKELLPAPNPKVSRQQWEQIIARYQKTIQDKKWQMGNPIDQGLANYFGFLNSIANDWCRCADPEMKAKLAKTFHTTHDWLQEQGLVVNGACGKANNYVGRLYVDAATKMRDALKEHGNVDITLNYLKWAYHYDDQVFGENHHESMDYFHNEALRLLRIANMHADPVERYHHVETFRDVLGKQLQTSIKPDGSIFHHGFHYFAYGSMGMNSVSGTLALMSQAGFAVAEEGLDMAKLAVMKMRWYSGSTTLWSLSGRNPAGTQRVPVGAFLNLAKAYAPYREGKWDSELTAAYLRFQPDQAEKPEFQGYQAETSPNGFDTMPYAALGMHRRQDWLAGVKGYSKYAASGESYANANRHGYYLSMGQLELLTHPDKLPTVLGSGTRPNEGYDWCAIEGATTFHSPLDKIANGNGTRMPRSQETFVGGLSHDQRNGVFVLTQNSAASGLVMRDRAKDSPKPEPFKALKSWFFFDNRIICLGSNISTKHVRYPARTNLFQKFLTDEFSTTIVNGEKFTLADSVIAKDYTEEITTLTDPYGNSYITSKEDQVHLRIGKQSSRDGSDKKDTKGNYATAWIEHGIDPQDAGYQYAVLVQPKEGETEAFAKSLPYKVLKKDAEAHIVLDKTSKSIGHVIFNTSADLTQIKTPLVSTSIPALVMTENTEKELIVSFTNPDARTDASEPLPTTITLKGEHLCDQLPEGVSTELKDGNTLITASFLHSEPVTIHFTKPLPLVEATEIEESHTTSTVNYFIIPGEYVAMVGGGIALLLIGVMAVGKRSKR
ncbi:chondroitin sulfate ABC exolyase [Rubritalea halochordaticola]|uniref:Chondroitin sulfate ABC exolyase n=1 Tax=Rubritalea halochordaticola TaxID=714537 RepID=A0ABP9V2U1_9BACT